jgi:hypothetical protein
MNSVCRPILKTLAGLFVAALCAYPQATISARPGTINYVEGHAAIDGQQIDQKQIGHLNLDVNQTISTDANSKAEVLLTPGVFLRLGNNSEVKMLTASLTDTRVAVTHGEALVDVAQLYKENNIHVLDDGASAHIEKTGLYRFNADNPQIAVIDGKATVLEGDNRIDLKKGREVSLNFAKLRADKFNTKQEDDLYAWSNLRSEYAAEASYATARSITVNNFGGGWGSWGTGWFWNPWYSSWAFVPGAGYAYSPFGWGFYSPGLIYSAPLYYAPGRTRPVPVNTARLPLAAGPRPGISRGAIFARPRAVPMGGGFAAPRMAAPRMAAPRMGGFGRR